MCGVYAATVMLNARLIAVVVMRIIMGTSGVQQDAGLICRPRSLASALGLALGCGAVLLAVRVPLRPMLPCRLPCKCPGAVVANLLAGPGFIPSRSV